MQTNDVQLIRLYTTTAVGAAQDNTPSEVAGTTQADFYLAIAAEAGDAVGDAGMQYTLYINATSPSGGKTTFTRKKLAQTVTDGHYDWKDVGKNNGYVKLEHIQVPAAEFPPGDVYQFSATLLTKNGIMSSVKSNEFVTF